MKQCAGANVACASIRRTGVSLARTESFSTDRIAGSRRLTYWNDIAIRTFGDISVSPFAHAFSGRLSRMYVGDLMLADVRSSAARIEGGRKPSGGRGGWFLLLNETGESRVWQARREAWLGPGDLTVLSADRPYRLEFEASHRMRVLHVPPQSTRLDLEKAVARRIDGEPGRLVSTSIRHLMLQEAQTPHARSAVAREILDALALSVSSRSPGRGSRSMQDWCDRLTGYVAARFGDPDLTPARLAERFGISTRFLHLVFARTGRTAETTILEQRLRAAAARLSAEPNARITDLAFDCGFTDLSRFCHAFQRRYGMSAGQWRSRGIPLTPDAPGHRSGTHQG
jgi:AraC family transcriptional regulator, positive regulator of tynA and feaB